MKVLKAILYVLLYIWQLPQNIAGLLILAWAALTRRIEASCKHEFSTTQRFYYVRGFSGGISLGEQIILNATYLKWNDFVTEHHEYGHCKQSRILGPLYLFVIGIPSITWAAFYKYNPNDPYGYYRFYTEKWADKLGGVER